MARCATCGNEYEHSFQITQGDQSYTFDSFECAIHKMAPRCSTCECSIMGHGVQSGEEMFCSAHCARAHGVTGIKTRVTEYRSVSS